MNMGDATGLQNLGAIYNASRTLLDGYIQLLALLILNFIAFFGSALI